MGGRSFADAILTFRRSLYAVGPIILSSSALRRALNDWLTGIRRWCVVQFAELTITFVCSALLRDVGEHRGLQKTSTVTPCSVAKIKLLLV